jgi:hypothetical protein
MDKSFTAEAQRTQREGLSQSSQRTQRKNCLSDSLRGKNQTKRSVPLRGSLFHPAICGFEAIIIGYSQWASFSQKKGFLQGCVFRFVQSTKRKAGDRLRRNSVLSVSSVRGKGNLCVLCLLR